MSRGDRILHRVCIGIISAFTLLVIIPIMNVFSSSFSSPNAVNAGRVLVFPIDATLNNYKTILGYGDIWTGYRNTLFYVVLGTMINLFFVMSAAYPLSLKKFSGRNFFAKYFYFTTIFGGGIIPMYMLIKKLGMLNTIWAIMLPGAMQSGNMILARTFMMNTIPDEMLEAARIDGCSYFRYFFKFILPLSTTIIAVIGMYNVVGIWNSYWGAFIYLNDRNLFPLQLFLREILINNQFDAAEITDPEVITGMQGLADTLKYVVIVVSTLPLMLAYPFVQKYFIKGVMIGSVKG